MIVLDPDQEARCDLLFEALRPLGADACRTELELLEIRGEHDDVLHLLKKMLALPADAPGPVTRIGEYDVLESLGEGGMGEVYLVQDRDLDRTLAAKVLRPGTPAGHVHRIRFEREAYVLGRLQHPNIVPIHGYGVTADGRPFYTMKHVRGETLRTLIEQRRLTRQALLMVFERVCDAVAFAHSRDVLHRDLKPANIMVGEFGEVQVMDWGIARVGARALPRHGAGKVDTEWTHITETGDAFGTPGYMSPEQSRGEPVNECTDVYGLGAVLFELLTGRAPRVGAPRQRRMTLFKRPATTIEEDLDPGVPWELRAVVLRAMDPTRDRRYASVADLRDDIVRYRERNYLRGIRYSALQRAQKGVGRHPRVLATMLACVIAVPAAVVAYQKRYPAETVAQAPTLPSPPPEKTEPAVQERHQPVIPSKPLELAGDIDGPLRRLLVQAETLERAVARERSADGIEALKTALDDLRVLAAAIGSEQFIAEANAITRRVGVAYDSRSGAQPEMRR